MVYQVQFATSGFIGISSWRGREAAEQDFTISLAFFRHPVCGNRSICDDRTTDATRTAEDLFAMIKCNGPDGKFVQSLVGRWKDLPLRFAYHATFHRYLSGKDYVREAGGPLEFLISRRYFAIVEMATEVVPFSKEAVCHVASYCSNVGLKSFL